MKVDAKDHPVNLPNEDQGEDQGTGGTTPATPRPQPRIYPTADESKKSGAEKSPGGGSPDSTKAPAPDAGSGAGQPVSDKAKQGKPDKSPDKSQDKSQNDSQDKNGGTGNVLANPTQAAPDTSTSTLPSPSAPPPGGNALQFKVGGVISAVPPLKPSWDASLPGQMTKPGMVQRSNRAGYVGGNLAGNVIRVIKDTGGVAQAEDKQQTTQSALQLGKDVGNATGYGIDLSRVPDKKEMKASYRHGAHRQGLYDVPPPSGVAGSQEQIKLKSMHRVKAHAGTQTTQQQTLGGSAQSSPHDRSRASSQASPGPFAGPAQPSTSAPASQAAAGTSGTSGTVDTPDTRHASSQTTATSHASTQTAIPPAPRRGRTDRARSRRPGRILHDSHPPAGSSPLPKTVATQTAQSTQPAVGSAGDAPGKTDAGVQVKPLTRERSSQQAPAQQPTVQTTSSGTASPAPVQTSADASAQTDPGHPATDSRASQPAASATAAPDAGASQAPQGTQTDASASGAKPLNPATQSSGTQTAPQSAHRADAQSTPAQVSAQTQTQPLPSVPDAPHRPDSSDKSIQTTWSTQTAGTQTPGRATPADATVHPSPSGEGSAATPIAPEHASGTKPRALAVPASVKGSGHWVVADIPAMTSDIYNVTRKADLGTISTVASTSVLTVGDTLSVLNASGNRYLTVAAKSLSLIGTTIGLVPSVGQLANDVKQLIANPKDEQSKWNVAKSAFDLGAGLAATAAALVFPPAALLPIIFPNLAEIGHAEILRHKKNELRTEGLNTEAAAVESRYKIAALDATPIVNWFSSTYTPELRPAIEQFETRQGNKPGGPPAGELPSRSLRDQQVHDYYAQAMTERAQRLATAGKGYLKGIADASGLSSVTMVSRSPQVFGWPTNGQAMRVFDRAVAITYDRVHDTVRAEFFGADQDGTYRLPTRDPSLPSGKDSKNLLFCSNMLDPEAKNSSFDMPQYFADTGTYAVDFRKRADKA